MEKKFKPYDKVIARFRDKNWMCDLYSHYNAKINRHVTFGFCDLEDDCILPYEGNEHLVGTTDSPDEEVRLEEGEICVFTDAINEFLNFGIIAKLVEKKRGLFCDEVGRDWCFAIRFKDFDPSNMEETRKHILCVKNGKIVRYKNN